MKKTWNAGFKKWFAVVICLIFTISGISVTNDVADSFFSHADAPASVYTTRQLLENEADAATGEQIGACNTTAILQNGLRLQRQNQSRILVACFLCLSFFAALYFGKDQWQKNIASDFALAWNRVIHYIHKKDGAKD